MAVNVQVKFTNASFTPSATEPFFVSDKGIEGYITIHDRAQCGFNLVKISLEGVLLNSLKYKNSPGAQAGQAKKFQVLLRMADVKKRSDFVRVVESGRTIAKSPFRFHIPHCLGRNLLGEDSEFLSDLPASLSCSDTSKIGANSVQFSFGDSHVFYTVRADVIGHGMTLGTVLKPVRIVPALRTRPPICVSDFGNEYTTCKTKAVRGKGRFSLSKIGECTVEAVEPEPITLQRLNGLVKLSLTLKITLEPNVPREWEREYSQLEQIAKSIATEENKISSALISSTYVSVVPRRGVPTPGEADKSEKLARSESVCSRTAQALDTLHSWSQNPKSGLWHGVTTTHLVFRDFSNKEPLIPTFDSSLVSHRYRVALRVNLSSLSRTSFVLDVPVMVRYCSNDGDHPPSFDEIHPPVHIVPDTTTPSAWSDALERHFDHLETQDILLDADSHPEFPYDIDASRLHPRAVGIAAPPYVV